MSQTLWQISKPNKNNAVINTLPLVLYSSNRSNPQFKYVLDVYTFNSNTRLTRVKFVNNDADNDGAGVIDLAPIVRDYLDYDQPWKVTGDSNFTQGVNAGTFVFVGGEEWATTTSSSAQIYNGSGSVGEPAYTASINNLFLAVNEYDEGVDFPSTSSYNWDFDSYAGLTLTNYHANTSSAYPKKIYNGDYETITLLDNISGSQSIDITAIEITIKSGSTTIYTEDILTTPSSPTDSNMMRYIGVGPQNLSELSASFSSSFTGSWTSYEVYTDISINDNKGTRETTYYYENGECTNYTKTRFAFINKLGTWDYFNIDLPYTKSTTLSRKKYTKTHLQYQSQYNAPAALEPTIATPIYRLQDRGITNYYIQPTDKFKITSNWVDEQAANWLTELFDSPEVYVQIDNNFQPINITSANYTWKTNSRAQKVFQFNIDFEYSNKRFNRS